MSELYVTSDGFRPLPLPELGEDLQPGRQYCLTPLARLILEREYGYAGLPTVVECIHRKVGKTTITTHTFNHDTRKHKVSRMKLDKQEETFKAHTSGGWKKFVFSIARLDELAPYYDPSHKLPGSKWKDTDPDKLAKLEEDWFKNRHLPSTHKKLAGRTIRWWSKHELVDGKYVLLPEYRNKYSGPRKASSGGKMTESDKAHIADVLGGLGF